MLRKFRCFSFPETPMKRSVQSRTALIEESKESKGWKQSKYFNYYSKSCFFYFMFLGYGHEKLVTEKTSSRCLTSRIESISSDIYFTKGPYGK